MKLLIFSENYFRGGVDTFLVTLINHWPDPDTSFTLVCNHDHPGLADISANLQRPCEIVTHRIATFSGLAIRYADRPIMNFLRKLVTPVLKYLMLGYAVLRLQPLLANGGYDRLLVVNGGYPAGDTCRAAGIAWGVFGNRPPSIHNFHNLAIAPRRAVRIQENMVDRLLARYTESFVTVSKAAAASMALRPCIPCQKVSYIYNGLPEPALAGQGNVIRRELALAEAVPLCVMLGTYEPRKGHRFLLQVFRKVVDACPTAHLLICGHGTAEEIAALRGYVDELGLQQSVTLMGFRRDALAILSQADLLLVASQEFESFGLTCVEAMARRVAVVATDVGGLAEVVKSGDGGYSIPHDNVSAYADAVVTLLRDCALRQTQGELGCRRFQRMFTATRMTDAYASLYGRPLATRSPEGQPDSTSSL